MSLTSSARLALGVALFAGAGIASAQSPIGLSATRRDTVVVGLGGAVTAVFSVRNHSDDSLTARASVALPRGWSTLVGTSTIALAPQASDTWLVSVAAPAMTLAGTYVLRAALSSGSSTAVDSIIVRVPERRAIELIQSDAPAFVGNGDRYEARFALRNRGNTPLDVSLAMTSSAGSSIALDATTARLAPGDATTVTARLAAHLAGRRALEDVLELTATDRENHSIADTASSNTLIVPRRETRAANLATVPAELAVRATGATGGVSPLALRGGGPVAPGSATIVDFALQLPADGQSVFGERDEYRFEVNNRAAALRLGDGSYTFSPLTSSGFVGFGGEMQRTGSLWTTGAYVTKDRWSHTGASEVAWLGKRAFAGNAASASTVLLGRTGGARVGAVQGHVQFSKSSSLDVEAAASDSAGIRGMAQRAQFTGEGEWLSYDLGFLRSGPTFAGWGRGSSSAHLALNAHPDAPVSIGFTANTYAVTPAEGSVFGPARSTTAALEATFREHGSVAYDIGFSSSQSNTTMGEPLRQALRARAHYRLGDFDLRGNASLDVASFANGVTLAAPSIGAAIHTDFGRDESVDLYIDRSGSALLNAVSIGGVNAGMAAQLQFPFGVRLSMNGSTRLGARDASAKMTQADITLSKPMRNDMTIALRHHVAVFGQGIRLPEMNGTYLELRAPLRIPTMRGRATGRAEGRVVDATTGRGLSNVLVRIGNESVITDAQGRATVSGLEPGRYRVNLETADRTAGVVVGDAIVEVSEESRRPAAFNVALAQGARLRATVRQSAFSSSLVTSEGDSLVDAGALEGIVVALEGTRDTVYQTTGTDGRLDFGVVAPGAWNVRVVATDVPAYHAFENEHYTISLGEGETRGVNFRLVPKRRALKIMGPEAPEVIRSPNAKLDKPSQPRN